MVVVQLASLAVRHGRFAVPSAGARGRWLGALAVCTREIYAVYRQKSGAHKRTALLSALEMELAAFLADGSAYAEVACIFRFDIMRRRFWEYVQRAGITQINAGAGNGNFYIPNWRILRKSYCNMKNIVLYYP